MRRLALLLLCVSYPALAGFTYSRTITIDHTKCGASDSTSFPILVSASDATLKDVAHGGHVQSSTGADILFFSDAPGTTQIASEIDYYDNVNGKVYAWVQVATVSHTANVTIYVFYGNGSPPARTTNPWDANYRAVYHLPNGTSITASDSTTNANNATSNTATATTGQVDGGAAYAGNGTTVTTIPTSATLNFSGAYTLEVWVFPTVSNVFQTLIVRSSASGVRQYGMYLSNTGVGNLFIGAGGGGGNTYAVSPNWTVNAWNHIVVSSNGTTKKVYINGVQANSSVGDASASTATASTYLGYDGPSAANGLNGRLDEARVSNTTRSADWVLTEYNNQTAPGNIGTPGFLTWGSEVATLGGGYMILQEDF